MLKDKFNILNNSLKNTSQVVLDSKIDSYLENMINTNEIILHPEFFLQLKYFTEINYNDNILNFIEKYLTQTKGIIKGNIKKGKFDFENGLNGFTKKYFEKIQKLSNNLTIDQKNKLFKSSFELLNKKIIQDPQITIKIKEEIQNFEETNMKQIKDFYNLYILYSQNLSEEDKIEFINWFNMILKSSLEESFDGKFIFEDKYPIPEKIQKFVLLSKMINNFDVLINNINFLKNTNVFSSIADKIIKSLIDLIQMFDINETFQLLESYNMNISKIIKYHSNIDSCNNMIQTNFIISIDNTLSKLKKSIDLNYLEKILNACKMIINIIPSLNMDFLINYLISHKLDKNKIQNEIIDFIDYNIRNKIESTYIIFDMLGYFIINKQDFISNYNKKLIVRLINVRNVEHEKYYYDIIKQYFDYKMINNTNKIIYDMECIILHNKNIDDVKNDSITSNILTASYNVWDIDYKTGEITCDYINGNYGYELEKYMYNFQKYYDASYDSKRKLSWYPHYGEIKIEFQSVEGPMDITLLPIQYMILERIEKNKPTKIMLLKDKIFDNYTENFKTKIIDSLVFGGLIKMTNRHYNINVKTKPITSDFISLYFNKTD